MEHGLLAVEFGDGRKDTTSIAGQENNVAGMVGADAWDFCVFNIFDGIRAIKCVSAFERSMFFFSTPLHSPSGIFGQCCIIVVDDASDRIKNDVLEDGTKADSIEDIGLLLRRQTDAFGVTTTLNVEHTSITPAVLVITNERTLRIRRQSCLAGAGKAKEHGHVTVLSFISGGVEGEDVVLDWHFVEEDGENALLHLTSVLGAKNDHLLLGKVDCDGGSRRHTCGVSIGGESASIVDDVVGMKALQVLSCGPDEHVVHKESMVGTSADNPHPNAISLVPSGEPVHDIDAIPGIEIVDGSFTIDSPHLFEPLAIFARTSLYTVFSIDT